MSPILSTPNTSPTPTQPGHWIVTKFGPPSVLKWQTWDPLPSLTGTNVLVRIIVAGISGADNIQRAGGYPHPSTTKPGFTTGYDFVGEVLALGPSVPTNSNLAIGDRVVSLCTHGAHATHIVLPHEKLLRIDPSDDPVKICALPINYMTAWGMLKHSGVNLLPGSSILLGSASGGLGTALAQLIDAFDLRIHIIGTCSPHKSEYVRSLGVEPIDRHAPDLVEQVRALTPGGRGVDVAYDMVCSEDSIAKSIAACKAEVGKVVVVGVMGEIAADGSGISKSVKEILGERLVEPRVAFYALDIEFFKKEEGVREFYDIVEKVRKGRLDPVVARVLPLREAVEAHELLIDGRAVMGRMVFVVDGQLAARYGV
ncbi:GroES-like protein [Plenodomus tracheiphilus IPT5]|uniref:GroES-like protein n=1 Tax=Plenodomus tracheiphilus IPT5 TaxID=1408161 RepID=A0A6A7AX97_9PLEO|nr:GroES-like protein [Plenodomus tracheiphilus IPT5]